MPFNYRTLFPYFALCLLASAVIWALCGGRPRSERTLSLLDVGLILLYFDSWTPYATLIAVNIIATLGIILSFRFHDKFSYGRATKHDF